MKIKVIATTNGATCKCTVEEVFEWLLEQVRIKVLAVPVGPGRKTDTWSYCEWACSSGGRGSHTDK